MSSGSKPSSAERDHGVMVQVDSQWMPEHSSPRDRRWAFSYTVTITNEGADVATLLARHWIITDADGNVEHVRGPGVVGYQPRLDVGETFSYSSGAILKTPDGVMQGEYLMTRPDGTRFEAEIPPFVLATPDSIH